MNRRLIGGRYALAHDTGNWFQYILNFDAWLCCDRAPGSMSVARDYWLEYATESDLLADSTGERGVMQANKCHNAEPDTFNHECGKPAIWQATNANGYQSTFCDECKQHGTEARQYVEWIRLYDA